VIKYLALAVGMVLGGVGGYWTGHIAGKQVGQAEMASVWNEQAATMLKDRRDRGIASERARAQREIARLKRSLRVIRQTEEQTDENCSTRPIDPCLRRYMELRDGADAEGAPGH